VLKKPFKIKPVIFVVLTFTLVGGCCSVCISKQGQVTVQTYIVYVTITVTMVSTWNTLIKGGIVGVATQTRV